MVEAVEGALLLGARAPQSAHRCQWGILTYTIRQVLPQSEG